MKKGDKAWVLCEVAGDSPCGALLMKGPQGTPFWANEKDCKLVQQEAAEELTELDSDYRDLTEKDFNRFMRGEKIEARFRDFDYQDWNRSKGQRKRKQFLAGVVLRNGKYRWVDDDNRSWMIAQVYDPKPPEAESEDDPFYEPWEIDVNEPSNPKKSQPEQASPIEHLRGWLEKGLWNVGAMLDATVVDVLNNRTKKGLDILYDFDIVEPGDLFHSSRDGKFHRCNFTMGMPVREAVLRGCQQRETWTFYRPKKVQA
jgi:hypothetical protein